MIICIIYDFMEQILVSIGTNFVMGFLSSISKFMKENHAIRNVHTFLSHKVAHELSRVDGKLLSLKYSDSERFGKTNLDNCPRLYGTSNI